MKNILFPIALLFTTTLHAQFYYNDLIVPGELSEKMKSFLAAKVLSVTATGFDPQGNKANDFNEWQEVRENGRVLKVTTRNGQAASRIYYGFDEQTRLTSTRDSAGDVQTFTEYNYDARGNLTRIKSTIKDQEKEFETEEHAWQYNSKNRPERMWRIINGSDSTEYRFGADESGNVADETRYRAFRKADTVTYYIYEDQRVYYYYDDQNRLLDIVRWDKKTQRMLPDVMFEYDSADRVIQRRTTVSTWPPDYLIWRYLYDERGLKTKEALFSKSRQLKGRIDYSYTFLP